MNEFLREALEKGWWCARCGADFKPADQVERRECSDGARTVHTECDPAPGSLFARDAGCVCPVMDNAHGRGSPMWGGHIRREDCPLHGKEAPDG